MDLTEEQKNKQSDLTYQILLKEGELNKLGISNEHMEIYIMSCTMIKEMDDPALIVALEMGQVILPEKFMDVYKFIKTMEKMKKARDACVVELNTLNEAIAKHMEAPTPRNMREMQDFDALKARFYDKTLQLGLAKAAIYTHSKKYPINTRNFYAKIEPILSTLGDLLLQRAELRASFALGAQ